MPCRDFCPLDGGCVKKCIHIPLSLRGCNYAPSVGRCRAHFVQTSLLVQGSEDVVFGYQAVMIFRCSQLFLPDGVPDYSREAPARDGSVLVFLAISEIMVIFAASIVTSIKLWKVF